MDEEQAGFSWTGIWIYDKLCGYLSPLIYEYYTIFYYAHFFECFFIYYIFAGHSGNYRHTDLQQITYTIQFCILFYYGMFQFMGGGAGNSCTLDSHGRILHPGMYYSVGCQSAADCVFLIWPLLSSQPQWQTFASGVSKD